MSIKETVEAAEAAMRAGDATRAIQLFTQVLARMPSHARAKKGLQRLQKAGAAPRKLTQADVDQLLALLRSGAFEAAASEANRLIAAAPAEALLHNILGMALSRLARPADAAQAFRVALRCNPSYAEAQANLGAALLELGRDDEAETTLQAAVRAKPGLMEAWHSLGLLASRRGANSEAHAAFDRALSLNPSYVLAMNSKASLLRAEYRFDEAVDLYARALKLAPTDVMLRTNYGYALSEVNRERDAIEVLGKVLQDAPDNAELWHRHGVLQAEVNDRAGAIASLRKALEVDPEYWDVYRTMSAYKTFTADDPDLKTLEALWSRTGDDPAARVHLGFALGKAREDIGAYRGAFDCWKQANAVHFATLGYSVDKDRDFLRRIKDRFSRDRIEAYGGHRNPTARPIFLVGMNRSGTTLVEHVLSGHSQVTGAGEVVEINVIARDNLAAIEADLQYDLTAIDRVYTAALDRFSTTSPRIVDKMPVNFRWIGLIKTLYPNATILNMTRDPRDTCLSNFKNFFESGGNEYTYDLEALATYYLLYQDIMSYWDSVFPGTIHRVAYEAITSDLETEARRLIAHCGLDWEPGVLQFHKTDKVVKTASIAQVREGVHTRSISGWKRYEAELQPLIRILEDGGTLDAYS